MTRDGVLFQLSSEIASQQKLTVKLEKNLIRYTVAKEIVYVKSNQCRMQVICLSVLFYISLMYRSYDDVTVSRSTMGIFALWFICSPYEVAFQDKQKVRKIYPFMCSTPLPTWNRKQVKLTLDFKPLLRVTSVLFISYTFEVNNEKKCLLINSILVTKKNLHFFTTHGICQQHFLEGYVSLKRCIITKSFGFNLELILRKKYYLYID